MQLNIESLVATLALTLEEQFAKPINCVTSWLF